MRTIELLKFRASLVLCLLVACLVWPACSVNVRKEANGEDKQVDIKTPLGGLHVSKGADVRDTGLPVYPGARLKPGDSEDHDKSANVNLSAFGFGLQVVALEYESDDAPAKLISYYEDQLKKYGKVLQCHSTSKLDLNVKIDKDNDHDSDELTCNGNTGSHIELKVGTRDNQHIVAVEPEGKGSNFSLVYVRTHGKQADI